MQIITLTTDLGLRDYYAASVKGAIYSSLDEVCVVDISHDVTKFKIQEAAFLLKNCYRDFPKGTIHIIGVQTDYGDSANHLLVERDGHYFLGSDNGLFSIMFEDNDIKAHILDIPQDITDLTFAAKSLYVKVAAFLARGGEPGVLGSEYKDTKKVLTLQPVVRDNAVRGTVVHIDSYGNLITNISKQLYERVGNSREGMVTFRDSSFDIKGISKYYNLVSTGDPVAIFNSSGLLEIAVNSGDAAKLMGMRVNDPVSLIFEK